MIREYLKMIGRRILRHKIYAIINVVGFTIAFTLVLLIYMHVVKEWKTDRFHRHADQIYRVTLKSKYDQNWSSYTSAPTAPYAAKEFPGIEEYVRVADWLFDVKKATDKEYLRNKNCLQVDKQFFDLFSFPLVSGDVKMIHIFTAIAILVGGMGILAFSMFMAESRRKEVALRKVNGAGVGQIILLLDRQFLGRILLACAIGLPIAHHLMTLWLRGFAYRTELPVGLYLGVAVICVVFVLLTVTWQIFRAARINPVDVLKNE